MNIWPVLGGLLAITLEYLYRRGLTWAPPSCFIVVPIALVLSYSISRTLQGSPTMLSGLIYFSVITTVLRIGVAFLLLGDPVRPTTLVAAGALLLATSINLVWR